MNRFTLILIVCAAFGFLLSCSNETPGISTEADAIKVQSIVHAGILEACTDFDWTTTLGGTRIDSGPTFPIEHAFTNGGSAVIDLATPEDFIGSAFATDVYPGEETYMFKIVFNAAKIVYWEGNELYTLDGSINYFISSSSDEIPSMSVTVLCGNVTLLGADLRETSMIDIKISREDVFDEAGWTMTSLIEGSVNGIKVDEPITIIIPKY